MSWFDDDEYWAASDAGWTQGEFDRFASDNQYLGPSGKEFMFSGLVDSEGNPVDPYEEREKFLRFSDDFSGVNLEGQPYNPRNMTLREARRIKDTPFDQLKPPEPFGGRDLVDDYVAHENEMGRSVTPERFSLAQQYYEEPDSDYEAAMQPDIPENYSMDQFRPPEQTRQMVAQRQAASQPVLDEVAFTNSLIDRYGEDFVRGVSSGNNMRNLDKIHRLNVEDIEKSWGQGNPAYNTPEYDTSEYIRRMSEEVRDYNQKKEDIELKENEFKRDMENFNKEYTKAQKQREKLTTRAEKAREEGIKATEKASDYLDDLKEAEVELKDLAGELKALDSTINSGSDGSLSGDKELEETREKYRKKMAEFEKAKIKYSKAGRQLQNHITKYPALKRFMWADDRQEMTGPPADLRSPQPSRGPKPPPGGVLINHPKFGRGYVDPATNYFYRAGN